nr:hypothetical protein [Staphylococcus pasteuri_A]
MASGVAQLPQIFMVLAGLAMTLCFGLSNTKQLLRKLVKPIKMP